ncbi:hypothetical protein [Streptomyces sp. A0592]|uniref:hypothetical protein n=1 Tax=Streptomyces sp. A0592 TaxID=2563099 RepID=UPI00109E5460|nr:hypothetical protein [Streptomyces sp. A0592]THA77838.1 hypothetical protein E6U81_34330 [Streptomyces sp. A0592]
MDQALSRALVFEVHPADVEDDRSLGAVAVGSSVDDVDGVGAVVAVLGGVLELSAESRRTASRVKKGETKPFQRFAGSTTAG